MSNLGYCEIGDSIRLRTELTNISSVLGNASIIKLSIVDDSNNIKINASNVSHNTTGIYSQDVFLDSNIFSTGIYYAIWSGQADNISFYHEDFFTIEINRLI